MALLSLSCVNAENIVNSTGELQSAPNTYPASQNTSNTRSFLVLDNDADKENIKIGEVVTWEVSVINLGNETAKGVKVYD